jgi:hypothetical protein
MPTKQLTIAKTDRQRVERLADLAAAFDWITFDERAQLSDVLRTADLFIRRVFGDESHYYRQFCALEFVPRDVIYNTGHYKYKEYWSTASTQFRSLLAEMRDDLALFGSPGSSGTLPDKITVPWLIHNVSWEIWVWFFGLLATAFGLGVALSQTTLIKEVLGR